MKQRVLQTNLSVNRRRGVDHRQPSWRPAVGLGQRHEAGVAGLAPGGSRSSSALTELARLLEQALAQGRPDPELAVSIVGEVFLGRTGGGGFRLTVAELQSVIRQVGPDNVVLDRLGAVFTPVQRVMIRHLRRRLNNDLPLPEDYADLQQAEHVIAAQRKVAEFVIAPIRRLPEQVLRKLNDLLAHAKRLCAQVADGLADTGYPSLAAVVQTLSDILVPGSTFEMVLAAIPIGRIGGVAKVVLSRIATSRPALSQVVTRVVSVLNKELYPPVRRLADHALSGDERALRHLVALEEGVNNAIPARMHESIARVTVGRDFYAMMEERFGSIVRRNPARLRPPPGSSATVTYRFERSAEASSGAWFVEVIEAPLAKRSGRFSSARRTAERAGLLSVEGQHWTHVWPDSLSGDDAAYVLIRGNARVNMSYLKPIDDLGRQDLAGVQMRVLVFFESASDALNRHAARVRWELTFPRDTQLKLGGASVTATAGVPFLIEANDLLTRPALTYKELVQAGLRGIQDAVLSGNRVDDAEYRRRVLSVLGIGNDELR